MNPTNALLGRAATSWTDRERDALAADWTERLARVGRLRQDITIVGITTRTDPQGTAIGYTVEATLHGGATWRQLRDFRPEIAADLDATTDRPVDVDITAGSRPSRVLVTVHPA